MTREKAIDWLCRLKAKIKIFMPYQRQKPFEEALDMAIKALEQEPRKGHWIEHQNNFTHLRECSCCKCYFSWLMPRNSYCPNCGADMREVTENE